MIAFDYLWILYAAPVIAIAMTGLAWWARARRVKQANDWSPQLGSTAASMGRRGPVVLGTAAFCAGLALAGPRFGGRVVTTETKALNLVVAVDISRSMLAEDVSPSRLGRARREAARLILDLQGDRIGLVAFAGNSWILSPLTVDAGGLMLLTDGLDPDIASTGGTSMAKAIEQSRQLLITGEDVADRVLVVFTDGEELDSIPQVLDAVENLRRAGVHLILVAEGGNEPVNIPVRDVNGTLIGYQRDPENNLVRTRRHDETLSRMADVARGTVVSAEVNDQAGTVRDLITAFKRAPQATTTAQQDIARGWIPLLAGVLILLVHTLTRRTAALAGFAALMLLPNASKAQLRSATGDGAWQAGDLPAALRGYLNDAENGMGGDTSWLNAGTAALALDDSAVARAALTRAAESLDPEIRFRASFNLGLLSLRLAQSDSGNSEGHLQAARDWYREALMLRPSHIDAKWNYELAMSRLPPPPSGGGGSQNPQQGGSNSPQPQTPPSNGLTRSQAEQILDSMLEEERDTRESLNRRRSRSRTAIRRRDW